jgi:multicomponent Na+:H+ antiporter subunit F
LDALIKLHLNNYFELLVIEIGAGRAGFEKSFLSVRFLGIRNHGLETWRRILKNLHRQNSPKSFYEKKFYMDGFFIIVSVFLLLNIALGLIRVWRGPTVADRVLTTQLFGTTGMAILLVLAGYLQQLTLLNVAITFNVLAIILVICLFQVWKKKKGETS